MKLIMNPHQNERPEQVEGRKAYLEKGDIKTALAKLPRFLVAERAILEVQTTQP